MSGHRKLVLVSLLALACAGVAPRPTPRGVDLATPEGEPAAALTPASAPRELVLVGRLNDPRRWLRGQDVPPFLRRFAENEASPAIAAEIDFAQPIEFAMGLDLRAGSGGDMPDADTFGAVSLGLKRWDPAWAAQPHGNCVVRQALGDAPARLICSGDGDERRRVEAYMARGLPLEPLGTAPAYLEFRPGPLPRAWEQAREGAETAVRAFLDSDAFPTLAIDPAQREALLAVTAGLMREANAWVHALERVTLEVSPTPDSGLEVAFTIHSRDPQPWLMAAHERAATHAAAPPARFELLPETARSGGYSWGFEPTDMAVLTNGAQAVWSWGGALASGLMPLPYRQQWFGGVDVVDEFLASPCAAPREAVWASVPHGPGVESHLLGTPSEARCGEFVNRLLTRMIGSKDAAAALAEFDPHLRLRKLPAPRSLGTRASVYRIGMSRSTLEMFDSSSDSASILPQLLGWSTPQLTGPIGIVRRDDMASEATALTLVVLSTPHGDWLGLSPDAPKLEQLLRQLAGSSPGRPSPRSELTRLRQPGTLGGEFVDADELVGYPKLRAWLEANGAKDALQATITSTLSVQREGRTLRARVSYFVPAPAVTALGRLLMLNEAQQGALIP